VKRESNEGRDNDDGGLRDLDLPLKQSGEHKGPIATESHPWIVCLPIGPARIRTWDQRIMSPLL
jgi:hypothetical protein